MIKAESFGAKIWMCWVGADTVSIHRRVRRMLGCWLGNERSERLAIKLKLNRSISMIVWCGSGTKYTPTTTGMDQEKGNAWFPERGRPSKHSDSPAFGVLQFQTEQLLGKSCFLGPFSTQGKVKTRQNICNLITSLSSYILIIQCTLLCQPTR